MCCRESGSVWSKFESCRMGRAKNTLLLIQRSTVTLHFKIFLFNDLNLIIENNCIYASQASWFFSILQSTFFHTSNIIKSGAFKDNVEYSTGNQRHISLCQLKTTIAYIPVAPNNCTFQQEKKWEDLHNHSYINIFKVKSFETV